MKETGKKAPYQRRDHRASEGDWRQTQTREPDENMIVGRNAVRELLASARDIDKVFVLRGEREGSIGALIAQILDRRIPLVEIDRRKMDTMSGGANHQGIIAYAAARDYASIEDILARAKEKGEKPFILIADGVEDPHNLGAIIRSAECAGVHGVIIPKRRAVGLTSVVAKTSAGAIEHMPVARVPNLTAAIEELKKSGVWVYAADMNGTAYEDTDFSSGVALVLGSEGEGISRLVSEHCDMTVSIPMYGMVNSMNVSAAAAVLMTEVARQRNRKK